MKLYHHPISSNARKTVMTASILGSDVELVTVDLTTGKNQGPDYLKLNPMGKVPTLIDGAFVLWESHAIMQYLADKKPGNTLYPSELVARADVNRWLFWASAHWSPTIALLVFQNLVKKRMGKGEPDPVIVAYAESELARFAKVIDDHLEGREYVSGKTLTIADFGIAAPLMYAEPARLPVGAYAHLQTWFGRIRALDVWQKTNPQMG